MNAVDLDWALISKVPGQRDDYGLLRSSATGRLRPGAMARMVSHFSPGSPSSPGGEHRERADALPWVTFTFATVASSRYVGVAIREWPWESTAPVDATGRPIVPTRFFCLPLEDFERYFGSCLALYQAVAKLAVPERNDDPLSVLVQSHDEEASRARERLLGDSRMFTAAAAVAAAVLDGPVALTPGYQSPRYPLADRIAFIDAVAALLPAGVRATLSAGTWVDNRTSHKIRLAFTHRLRDGLGEIDPDDPPGADTVTDRHGDGIGRGGDPTRDSGHSHIYAENLKKLCHHWGSDAVPVARRRPQTIQFQTAGRNRRRARHGGAEHTGRPRPGEKSGVFAGHGSGDIAGRPGGAVGRRIRPVAVSHRRYTRAPAFGAAFRLSGGRAAERFSVGDRRIR